MRDLIPKPRRQRRRGVIAVLAAFLLIMFLGILALSIDTGMMYNSRNDLQRAVDSGALAAVKELIRNPGNAVATGRTYTQANMVLSQTIAAENVNVETGFWSNDARLFTPDTTRQYAVRVTGHLDNNVFFFGRALGATSFNMQASAVAMFQPRDIMLTLDYSGSMLDCNKIENLKQAVQLFCNLVIITGQGNDRIGFVRYSTTASLEAPLTYNVSQVSSEASSGVADGWTNIGDGLGLSLTELLYSGRSRAKKIIVLLTDGNANKPDGVDPLQYVRDKAALTAGEKIPIYAISFGTDADQTLMAEIASSTAGVHFHVDTDFATQAADLNAVFSTIAYARPNQLVD